MIEVVDERIGTRTRHIGVVPQIPSGIEPWSGTTALVTSVEDEVIQRVLTDFCDIGISFQIPLRIKQIAATDQASRMLKCGIARASQPKSGHEGRE